MQIFILNIKSVCECFASAIEGSGQSNDKNVVILNGNANRALERERERTIAIK